MAQKSRHEKAIERELEQVNADIEKARNDCANLNQRHTEAMADLRSKRALRDTLERLLAAEEPATAGNEE